MSWSLGPTGLDSGETYLDENFPKVFDAGAGGTYGYTNTGGNNDYQSSAYRLAKINGTATEFLKAKIYKQGDLNYSDQIHDVDFALHQWSSTPTVYGLHAVAGVHNLRSSYLWVDSNKELWFWAPTLWTQYARFEVMAASSNITFPFTTTNNMHTNAQNGTNDWTGQTRQLVNNTTSINIENAYGGPA